MTQVCPSRWVVSATQARQLIEQGATILDSRPLVLWLIGHVPSSIHVSWQQFSEQHPPHKGKLLENSDVLARKLRALGIDNAKPAIAIGNPAHPGNFGEEGRIVWMLRTLGHPTAAFVDGGHPALVQAGCPVTLKISQPVPGHFTLKRTVSWTIERAELQAQSSQALVVIDTRSPQEFAGATPYGEARGGHIPGATHLYFKDLKDAQGYLLPDEQIIAKLNHLGIQFETPIAAYCTGGIRSAFLVAVLTNAGFTNVKNYPGSMWDWSAAPAMNHLLT